MYWLYFGELPKLENGQFYHCLDLTVKFEFSIHFNPEVCDSWLDVLSQATQIDKGGLSGIDKHHHFCLLCIII